MVVGEEERGVGGGGKGGGRRGARVGCVVVVVVVVRTIEETRVSVHGAYLRTVNSEATLEPVLQPG